MKDITKSQKRHRQLKADSELVPRVLVLLESLAKEVSIIKKKVNSIKADAWCGNNGHYYSDKFYKVKYYNGSVVSGYGSAFEWETFEQATDREEEEHYRNSNDAFVSSVDKGSFIEFYQLAEVTVSKVVEDRLCSIEEIARRLGR